MADMIAIDTVVKLANGEYGRVKAYSSGWHTIEVSETGEVVRVRANQFEIAPDPVENEEIFEELESGSESLALAEAGIAYAELTDQAVVFVIGDRVQVEEGWSGVVTAIEDDEIEVEAEDGTTERFHAETLAIETFAKPKKARKPKTADNPCQCGCGESVKGRYKQGHDARHKSALLKAARGGSVEATAELVKFGWDKFIVTETERRKQAKAAETVETAPITEVAVDVEEAA